MCSEYYVLRHSVYILPVRWRAGWVKCSSHKLGACKDVWISLFSISRLVQSVVQVHSSWINTHMMPRNLWRTRLALRDIQRLLHQCFCKYRFFFHFPSHYTCRKTPNAWLLIDFFFVVQKIPPLFFSNWIKSVIYNAGSRPSSILYPLQLLLVKKYQQQLKQIPRRWATSNWRSEKPSCYHVCLSVKFVKFRAEFGACPSMRTFYPIHWKSGNSNDLFQPTVTDYCLVL